MKRTTNTEFLTELMDFSQSGALMQAFILEGIGLYAKNFLEHEKKPKGWPEYIDYNAWRRCATEVVEALNARYSKEVSVN